MAVRDTTDALQLAGNLAFLAGGMDADDLIGETVRGVVRDSSHVITFTYQDANGDIQTIAMPTLVSLDLNGSVVVASLGDGTSVSVDLSPLQTGVVVPNYTRYITISDDGTFTGASFLDPNTGGSSVVNEITIPAFASGSRYVLFAIPMGEVAPDHVYVGDDHGLNAFASFEPVGGTVDISTVTYVVWRTRSPWDIDASESILDIFKAGFGITSNAPSPTPGTITARYGTSDDAVPQAAELTVNAVDGVGTVPAYVGDKRLLVARLVSEGEINSVVFSDDASATNQLGVFTKHVGAVTVAGNMYAVWVSNQDLEQTADLGITVR